MDAIAEANALAVDDETARALPLYEEAVRQNPDDERGYYGAVLALLHMKQNEKAAEWMERLIRLRPDDAHLHGLMGSVLEGCGKTDEALACYEKALGIDPDDIMVLFRASPLLIRRGRTKEGMECFNKAMGAEPSDEHEARAQREIMANIAKVQEMADDAGAEAALAEMRQDADGGGRPPGLSPAMPGMPGMLKALFAEYLEEGSPQEAMARASALSDEGKLDEAMAAIDGAIAEHPDLADAHSVKAAILIQMGRYREAAELMDTVLRLRPDGPEDLCAKGMLLEKLGRRDEALACYDRVIEVEPGETMAYYLKCGALAHAGDARGLAECYRAALSSAPRDDGRETMQRSMGREYAELERCAQEAGSVEAGLGAFVDGGGVAARPQWGRAGEGARAPPASRRARGAGRAGRLRAGRRR